MPRLKTYLGVSIFGVMFVAMTAFLCIWSATHSLGSLFHPHPTDEQLIDNYIQHKAEFNQLAQMLIDERELLVIFPDSGKCQVAGQRLMASAGNKKCAEYVRLFRLLGLKWAYSGDEPLYLTVSTSGLSVSGSRKGYVYTSKLPTPPGTMVGDTDHAKGLPLPYYRHIEDNWYIYFDD